MSAESSTANSFEAYREDIIVAAGAMYGAIRRGETPDSTRSRVDLSPINPGEAFDAQAYMLREAQLNCGVRKIVRYCVLLDDAEEGGFIKSRGAKIELFFSRVIERATLKGALGEDGIIEAVRRPFHPDPTIQR